MNANKIKGDTMKNLVWSALFGLALIAFTGCTTGNNTEAGAKCSSSKCASAKKCSAGTKCSADKAKDMATKCSAGKCAK